MRQSSYLCLLRRRLDVYIISTTLFTQVNIGGAFIDSLILNTMTRHSCGNNKKNEAPIVVLELLLTLFDEASETQVWSQEETGFKYRGCERRQLRKKFLCKTSACFHLHDLYTSATYDKLNQ